MPTSATRSIVPYAPGLCANPSCGPAKTTQSASGALAAGSFAYRTRVPAVANALAITNLHNLSEYDRRRLIAAIFDPRVAPASQESWDA